MSRSCTSIAKWWGYRVPRDQPLTQLSCETAGISRSWQYLPLCSVFPSWAHLSPWLPASQVRLLLAPEGFLAFARGTGGWFPSSWKMVRECLLTLPDCWVRGGTTAAAPQSCVTGRPLAGFTSENVLAGVWFEMSYPLEDARQKQELDWECCRTSFTSFTFYRVSVLNVRGWKAPYMAVRRLFNSLHAEEYPSELYRSWFYLPFLRLLLPPGRSWGMSQLAQRSWCGFFKLFRCALSLVRAGIKSHS